MFFDTPVYFAFLVVVLLAYWRLSHSHQNELLLIASYFFYGWWDWRFLALIFLSTVVDFYCAKAIGLSRDKGRRRVLLTISLAVNLSFLGFFKYFNFFVDSLLAGLSALGVQGVHVTTLRILLPPGISFYTFQEIAYIVDVYRGRLEASDSLVDYALFISLFPHLIAGPIQQPSHLLPQVQAERRFDPERFSGGVLLILQGLFRKCVVADNCALLANAAFDGRLGAPSIFTLLIGVYAFAFQIYGDFSGYSDIARGSAQLLGFHFMVNFRQPYFAWSLQEFWRRWHISLGTWLRDYLYLPISYWLTRRLDGVRWLSVSDDLWIYFLATGATMLLGGLWHGANWTFVVWGGMIGLGLGLERLFWTKVGPKGRHNILRRTAVPFWSLNGVVCRLACFHLVCLTWVFFRSDSIRSAARSLASVGAFSWEPRFSPALAFLVAFAVPLILLDAVNESRAEEYVFQKSGVLTTVGTGVALLMLITVFSANELNAFVYFQF